MKKYKGFASGVAIAFSLAVSIPGVGAKEIISLHGGFEQDFLKKYGDVAQKHAPGAYSIRRPDGGIDFHTFGIEGAKFDLERFKNRLIALEKSGVQGKQRNYLLQVVTSLEDEVAAAKGLIVGNGCDGYASYELLGTYGTSPAGHFVIARSEIDLTISGPPQPYPWTTANTFATIYGDVLEPEANGSNEGSTSAFSETRIDCPDGFGCTYWETYNSVRAYSVYPTSVCASRNYNPSNYIP